ncbi:hypothetical protein CMUS01_06679 [Colletotrichum musicola]|uniref:Uncharacterized protein n=1 Tax=Colletotrichum musicola TaxID=2175873 RepID=A0A8H6KKV1_9PEZI|nr:hypothetical protein CMUS01_06679 [Colletotrichum musicola]
MAESRWSLKSHGYEPAQGDDVEKESTAAKVDGFKRYGLLSTAEWLYEIATSLFSLVLLAGIIAIFKYVDGKPLSAWPDYISLNAVIAIMTTACSAAIMHGVSEFISQLKWLHFKRGPQRLENFTKFDEASRGVWGSLKFLASVKWNLATVGAFITISRLAFAPLTQQVVKISDNQILRSDSQVTFGYAHTYMTDTVSRDSPLGSDMQSAIIRGLYNMTSPAIFSCPSECTWNGSYVDFGVRNPWNEGPSYILTNESRAHGIPALMISSSDLGAVLKLFGSNLFVSNSLSEDGGIPNVGLSAVLGGDVDIGRRFESVAASMTDYLRVGPNKQTALGVRIDREPFISIRWHYLAGPIAIELAALLFAGITIFANRRSSRAPLWKSSALAVLECTHAEETGLIQAKVKDIKTIETNAKNAL